MKKVYCVECQHLAEMETTFACFGKPKEDNWYGKDQLVFSNPGKLNKRNRCKLFVKKVEQNVEK